MKFDFCVGNPPYQDQSVGDNETFAPPVYNKFMDAAYKVADKVELIHPARFLFNAGSTPKPWNKKMLADKHFKVLEYVPDSKNIFANTEIKGGIAITYHDNNNNFGGIGTFTPYDELNSILRKVKGSDSFVTFKNTVITRTAYRLTDKLHSDHPEAINQLSNGHAYDMSTNIFDRIPQVFFSEKPNDGLDYIKIFGRENNERIYKWIRREYVNKVENLDKYKVFMPSANGNGTFGETLSNPVLSEPGIGATETFISIGKCDEEYQARNILKYIKTKFVRSLLGILKITQHITPEKWEYVPLQDFTNQSDIDWSKSVDGIDKILYKKYNLSINEVQFIENNVKEMD